MHLKLCTNSVSHQSIAIEMYNLDHKLRLTWSLNRSKVTDIFSCHNRNGYILHSQKTVAYQPLQFVFRKFCVLGTTANRLVHVLATLKGTKFVSGQCHVSILFSSFKLFKLNFRSYSLKKIIKTKVIYSHFF